MPSHAASFESFHAELNRLVGLFEQHLAHYKNPGYDEANVRQEFITPFFAALGWDMTNQAGLIPAHREVIVESRTGTRRADYFFRTDRKPRFICEAKRPAEELPGHAHQAKRDAWTIGVPLAVLTDFEELHLYVVGSEPKEDEPRVGLWKTYLFREYATRARELWGLLARDNVAGGVIDRTVQALPKKPLRIGKNQWVIRPDPTRGFDHFFLAFLDRQRRSLASDLLRHNERVNWAEGTRLNEAVQCILDRLLFIRISEARGIDMGTRLESLLETWEKLQSPESSALREEPPAHWGGSGLTAPRSSLWNSIVRHIRALDRRPPSHVPFFNGNLFKPHFSEELIVGDDWLAEFLDEICKDTQGYNFGYVAVEILGTIYERFLGKIVRPHGRGAVIEEKPEVRKAGGVYYTPRYIVEYIVEQTVGKRLDEIAGNPLTPALSPAPSGGEGEDGRQADVSPSPLGGERAGVRGETRPAISAKDFERRTLALRFLDPACGSGSFLLRVFERVCEHWQQWLTDHPDQRKKDWCWEEKKTNTVHLTARLKRRILRETIYGVDLDPQAVEVTQLSLYLKMLEGETTATLEREQDLFGGDEPILPPLQDNIKCGNSLIASDFSMLPADLVRVHAFDWPVQFAPIMKAGGFDAVVGNPPYILLQDDFRDDEQLAYFREHYRGASYKLDTYHLFIERGLKLCKANGRVSLITPSNFLTNNHLDTLRRVILETSQPEALVVIAGGVFAGVSVDSAVFVFRAGQPATQPFPLTRAIAEATHFKPTGQDQVFPQRVLAEARALFTSGIINPASDLWDRLSAKFPPLGSIADVNFGKQLRDRKKFLNDVIEVASRNALPKTHVACVTGKDIDRYRIEWSHLACLNDTVAQSGGCWDEAKHQAKGKLLTRQIGRFPSYALDTVGYHCLNTLFMVTLRETAKLPPAFLLGVLNSKLLRALWVGRFYDQRQTFPKIKGTYLKELPIALPDRSAPADKARHDKLVLLVDKMLALLPNLRAATATGEKATLQNAVTATDQQIDALVYELYGLTPEEIALVEDRKK